MRRIVLLYLSAVLLALSTQYANAQKLDFDSLTSDGPNKSIIWSTSSFGSGFGHKIYSVDPGSKTDLRFAARHNSGTWVDAMTITSDAKIGIGTSTPAELFEIAGYAGNVRFQSSGARISFTRNNANYIDAMTQGGYFIFNTSGAERMRLDTNGYLGIGTTAPQGGLHVTKVNILGDGTRVAATLGNAFNDWTTFGATTGGRIRGSSEGYLAVESNPAGTNKNLYLNVVSDGNVVIANGGGNVGIGTTNPQAKLAVNGEIFAKRVKVTQAASAWADFVFQPDYKLPSLNEVENYIKSNKHLPEIPSAAEVEKEGLDVGEMNKKLLQKVEELTLYLIEHQKRIESLESKNASLENEIRNKKGVY